MHFAEDGAAGAGEVRFSGVGASPTKGTGSRVQEGSRRPKVLLVDDQPENLLVFRASFEAHADIHTVGSAREALRLLETDVFPIVISDQRMPEMTGAQLLAEVRQRWPETIRILVTAYTSFDDVVAAINQGHVYTFIRKPWNPEDVVTKLFSANELYWTSLENMRLRAELLRRERLLAVGQLTSGLVHELGNIGTVLRVIDDNLGSLWPEGEQPEEVELLDATVKRFGVFIDTLRIYAKGGNPLDTQRVECSLHELAARSIDLARLFPQCRRLDVVLRAATTDALVLVDRAKIEHVLLNLIKNAAEAVAPERASVVVSVQRVDENAVVEVRDRGPGIPLEVAGRLWEGFFTTKGDAGTGLGLWMCRKIVESHGGTIAFENHADGGCSFYVRLPTAGRGGAEP